MSALQEPDLSHWLSGLNGLSGNITDYVQHLQTLKAELQFAFSDHADIETLITYNTSAMDALLQKIWSDHQMDSENVAMIAVGGYGRGELHPYSDIDLLILTSGQISEPVKENVSSLVTFLWDLGLDIGHSVRTVDECVSESSADITIITNLMESRFLCKNNKIATKDSVKPPIDWNPI